MKLRKQDEVMHLAAFLYVCWEQSQKDPAHKEHVHMLEKQMEIMAWVLGEENGVSEMLGRHAKMHGLVN